MRFWVSLLWRRLASHALGFQALIIVISAFGGLISFFMPFGRDHGNYAYAGWAFNSGARLYQDVLSFKPPMTVYVHSFSQLAFGHHVWSIRMLDCVIISLIALMIFRVLSACFFSPKTAFMGSLFYLLQYWGYDYWNAAQTDHWAQLPIVLSILIILKPKPLSYSRCMLSGFLGMAAVLFKYPFIIIWLPITVFLVVSNIRQYKTGRLVRSAIIATAMCMGGVVALLVFMSPMLSKQGLASFMDVQAMMVAPYAKLGISLSAPELLFKLLGVLFTHSSLLPTGILVFFATILVVLVKRPRTQEDQHPAILVLSFLWLACAALACLVQTKFFVYHYAPMLLPTAILGALAFDRLARRISPPGASMKLWVPTVCCVAWWLVFLGDGLRENLRFAYDAWRHPSLPASYDRLAKASMRDYSLVDITLLADYLSENTNSGDKVFIWGFDPTVNFLVRRFSPTRFIYNYPFRLDPHNSGWTRELLYDLHSNPPAKVVIARNDDTFQITGNTCDSLQLLDLMPELSQYLQANYQKEGLIGSHYILLKPINLDNQ